MIDLYVNTNSPIKHKVLWQGEIVAADSAPTVAVYDITEDATLSTLISPATLLVTLTSTAVETDIGVYQVFLPLSYVQRTRKFKFVWSYTVSSSAVSYTAYVNVITPYVDVLQAADQLGISLDSSDPNYKTYYQLQLAESYARKMIESYTTQDFYLYDDVEVVYGGNSDILTLPYKINSIHKLYANDILLVNNLTNVNNWLYTPIVSETGFGIRVDRTTLIDNIVYTANGMVPPSINDTYTGDAFVANTRYRVAGRYGWPSVPVDVQQACTIIMGDYFSKDSTWKNKYIKNIQTFDWQFEYASNVYSGTGNVQADQLLEPYVVNRMIVI